MVTQTEYLEEDSEEDDRLTENDTEEFEENKENVDEEYITARDT